MITKRDILIITGKRLIQLFGESYIMRNLLESIFAIGEPLEGNRLVFYGFKTQSDFPSSAATYDGWVVYAQFTIDESTGQIINEEYAFPEECRG